ncbi:hypothetical protein ACJZ2D_014838 [Fusarium nematophilum]
MESFSDEEKRFLLAEMIKNGQLDTKILARFVKSNRIEPNWMQMQLPAGRNMAQCMQAAEGMDIRQRGKKRKISYKEEDSQDSNNDSMPPSLQEIPSLPRDPNPDWPSGGTAPSQATSNHVPILPRLLTTSLEPLSQYQLAAPPPKKKKGRPSNADRAKISLRPFLPRPIAPRPPAPLEPEQPPLPSLREIAPAPAPQQQLSVRETIAPYLPPVNGPSSTALRRIARRRILGDDNGFPGSSIGRSAEPLPLDPSILAGIKGERPEEELSASTSHHSNDGPVESQPAKTSSSQENGHEDRDKHGEAAGP